MPKGKGTSPIGQGGGMGRGGGQGRGGGNRPGSGPGGNCVCPQCGKEIAHQRGVPCYSISCPNCGANMRKQ